MRSLSEELGMGGDAHRQTHVPASRNVRFAASIKRPRPLAVMPLYGRRAILLGSGSEAGEGAAMSGLARVIAVRPKLPRHSRGAWIRGGEEKCHPRGTSLSGYSPSQPGSVHY